MEWVFLGSDAGVTCVKGNADCLGVELKINGCCLMIMMGEWVGDREYDKEHNRCT